MTSPDELTCPICLKPFEPADLCASDIELGICHAACLEGSPTVDLETGEPVDGPIQTYRYDEVSKPSAIAAPVLAGEVVRPVATEPFVRRLIRIFNERPSDDTSAVVLIDYAKACAATPPAPSSEAVEGKTGVDRLRAYGTPRVNADGSTGTVLRFSDGSWFFLSDKDATHLPAPSGAVGSLWAPAPPDQAAIGWSYDFDQIERIARAAESATGYDATMEVVSFVMDEADRRFKSALAQQAPEDWQPIETAPKNQALWLAWNPEDWTYGEGRMVDGEWIACGTFYDAKRSPPYRYGEAKVEPVFWMPLLDHLILLAKSVEDRR